jgi:RNA polymerase sigma factor for flagellar operon FliA
MVFAWLGYDKDTSEQQGDEIMSDTTIINLSTLNAEQFVEHYTKLVKRIAYHLAQRLPSHVLVEDLIQSGMIGLLEARDNFDDSKGASFETFASIRVRGAMLDELRRGDWAPRSVYRAGRSIAQAVRQIENETGRDAKDVDVAKALHISLDEYHRMLMDSANVHLSGYEESGVTDDTMALGLFSKLWSPQESLSNSHFKHDLADEISNLPERERLVIGLYYDEELTLKEIGEVLGVTESRVCQLHSQAVIRLKARLKDWK